MTKQIKKIFLLGLIIFTCLSFSTNLLASETGSISLSTGIDTGINVTTENCSSVTNGTVASNYPTCTVTCNSGYTLSNGACVWSGGGGGTVSGSSSSSSSTNKIGDANNDNKVDEYDFAVLMFYWGQSGNTDGDLNDDGIVDEYDLSLLMFSWGF